MIDIDGSAGLDGNTKWFVYQVMSAYQMATRLPVAGLSDSDVEALYIIRQGIESYIDLRSGDDGRVIQALMSGYDLERILEKFGYDSDKIAVLVADFITSVNDFCSKANINDMENIPYGRNLETIHIEDVMEKADEQRCHSQNVLRSYVDLVGRVAKLEYKKLPQWDNFKIVDYEELVSIGILAVEVLIKNKTPEQLAKYNELYIATAVTWAIGNELRIRYPWYDMLVQGIDEVTRQGEAEEYEKAGMDYQEGIVRIACYTVLAQVGHSYEHSEQSDWPLDFVNESKSETSESEIQKMWRIVKGCKNNLPEKYHECFDFYVSQDSDISKIRHEFSPEIIHGMFNEIKTILNENDIFGY